MKNNNNICPIHILYAMVFTISSIMSVQSQSISGPSSLSQGSSGNYSLVGGSPSNIVWNVSSGATITFSGGAFATVQADSPSGFTVSATFTGGGSYASKSVTVIPLSPSTPPMPTITKNCGYTRLTIGTPPPGVTYYWQSSSSGTNEANSANYVDKYDGSTYYLRAKNSGGWSSARTVNYTIDYKPGTPASPSVSQNNCGNTMLTRQNPSPSETNVFWFWQITADGDSTGQSGTTIAVNTGTTYYLRARNNITLCWSDNSSSVNYTVNQPTTWYADTDGDTFGDINSTQNACSKPLGFVTDNTDCDDSNEDINPDTIWFSDSDDDGFRDQSYTTKQSCIGGMYWTLSTIPDGCPNENYNSNGGCPPDCTLINLSPYYVNFTAGGGNQEVTVSFTDAECTSGTFTFVKPSWVNSVSQIGNTNIFTVNCSTNYEGPQSGIITILVDGQQSSTVLSVGQDGVPPPPDCATINGFNNTTFTGEQQTIPFILSFNDGNCMASMPTFSFTDSGTPVPNSEIGVQQTGGVLEITLFANNTESEKTFDLLGMGGSTMIFATMTQPCIAQTWYLDADNDNFAISTTMSCASLGVGYTQTVLPLGDCDDDNAAINPGVVWYLDADGDDHAVSSTSSCGSPGVGYTLTVLPVDDCDDNTYSPLNDCVMVPLEELLDQNYVYTRAYQNEVSTVPVAKFLADNDYIQDITYFDGLGRPMQQTGIRQAPDEKDIVTYIGYDAYGRRDKEWLSFHESIENIGEYRPGDMELATRTYYQANYASDFGGLTLAEINPYSQKAFEASPLNRVERQAAPGEDWKLDLANDDHSIEFNYLTNTHDPLNPTDVTNDNVSMFITTTVLANNTYMPTLEYMIDINSNPVEYYTEGELYKSITKDENHDGTATKLHTTEEFTDKQGRVVLKRTYALINGSETMHDTYYVYDDYGNLTYVLPPLMDASTETLANLTSNMDALGYQYIYDYRNRLVEKHIPGKGWEYIVYNKLDQPILTQDTKLKDQGKWLFTNYDAFGRVVVTGLVNLSLSRTQAQSGANAATVQYEKKEGTYYSFNTYPQITPTNSELYTVNFYDDYNFDTAGYTLPTDVYGEPVSQNVKGLLTGSFIFILLENEDKGIGSVVLYDKKGRVILNGTVNEYLGTTDIVESKLDFTGKVEKIKTTHIKGASSPIITEDEFTYDHMGRILIQKQTIGSHIEVLVNNSYDNLGQLKTKKVGGNLQTVDYAYNVRGWLKSINQDDDDDNDLFNFTIRYNNPTSGTELFNGNISQTSWNTLTDDTSTKTYTYAYDPLNRITGAIDNTGNYNLTNVSYDKNGNIQTLKREGWIVESPSLANNTGFGTMDDLIYTYQPNSNKLAKVADGAAIDQYGFKDDAVNATADTTDDYAYDDNGNMVMDRNKAIGTLPTDGIRYNHLNLPVAITISGGGNNGTIDYIYDAVGTKLQKIVNPDGQSSVTTDYAGNFIYENGRLQFFSHAEGTVSPKDVNDLSAGFDYTYNYKDHLGNVRLSYMDANGDGDIDPTDEIVKESNYYPFGLSHKGYNNNISSLGNSVAKRFMFGGKELGESLGLETYDFGARNYSPDLGRWMNIDPLAELMRNQSPYNYGFNNPIYFSDHAGNIPWPVPEMFKNWLRKNTPDEFFGWIADRGRNHYGLDLNYNGGGNTDLGAPIVATHSGRVARIITIDANDGGGRIVVIESPDGSFQTKYLHLSSVTVQPGDEIDEGQTIGLMGGSAFGKEDGRLVHLHYEIHRNFGNGMQPINPWANGAPVDPQQWIPQMGPHINAAAYNFGADSNFLNFPFIASEPKLLNSGEESPPSSGSIAPTPSRGRVSPVPITPQPIMPIPSVLPSGGGSVTPVNPPSPVFILPPKRPDGGF